MEASRNATVAKQYDTAEAAERYAEGYGDGGPVERFYRSRLALVSQVLNRVSGGDLLDVGCGPGMMVRVLLDTRPGDFRITAIDQSAPMVQACLRRAGEAVDVHGAVGSAMHAAPLEQLRCGVGNGRAGVLRDR